MEDIQRIAAYLKEQNRQQEADIARQFAEWVGQEFRRVEEPITLQTIEGAREHDISTSE